MRAFQKSVGIVTGAAAIVLVAAQTARAADIQITGVQLRPTGSGVQLILETAGSSTVPQVIQVPKDGNRLEAAILNSQLYLREGDRFSQVNPVAGIALIEMWQETSESVVIRVTGSDRQPQGQVLQREAGSIVFAFSSANPERLSLQRQNDPVPNPPSSSSPSSPNLPSQLPIDQQFSLPSPVAPNPTPTASASPATTNFPSSPTQPSSSSLEPNVLNDLNDLAQRSDAIAPNPRITLEGNPAPLAQPAQPIVPVPPLLPQPVPPPLGPIGVANVNVSQQILDLGTSARVPRIVLQEAPAREVLSLLARSADLNLIFADGAGGNEEGGERRISLDLQDEPVQDVFNYVIQATGLEATRKGRTIFVGTQLPVTAKDIISRTFRTNQISSVAASAFLTTLGAELQQQTVTTAVATTSVDAVQGGEDAAAGVGQATIENLETTRTVSLQSLTPGDDARGPLPLRGLTVSPDERLNQVTVIGEPRLVQMAGSYLNQLDARVRQVAVNVKVVDVDLSNDARFGASFSWGIGDTGLINQNGLGIINFGTDSTNIPEPLDGLETSFLDRGETPPQTADGVTFGTVGTTLGNVINPRLSSGNFQVVDAFLAQLQFSIQNNQARILTDPTLVVQEGQSASVNLTEEVVANLTTDVQVTDAAVVTTTTVEKEPVGLVLQVLVNRIDDNGFISMGINPIISSVGSTVTVQGGSIALINQRSLSSGQVRMRDGQTLILSGIILDQDRVSTQKIPLLGDIPIIGSLFRRTFRENQRAEVIVIVTPRILNDSQNANYGYSYTPGRDARQILQQQGFPIPPQ